MNFSMIILDQSFKTMENYVIWIQTALLFRLKLKIFTSMLQMVLLNGFTHQTVVQMIKDQFRET